MQSISLRRSHALSSLVVAAGLGLAGTSGAQTLRVTGTVDAYAATAQQNVILSDHHDIGSAYVYQPGPIYTAAANATAQYEFLPGDLSTRQTGQASAFAYAQVGGLRAAVSGSSAVGNYLNNTTGGGATVEESWSDVITFHTLNPLGTDYTFSITLDVAMDTQLLPSYVRNTQAHAEALTYFSFNNGGDPLLSVNDVRTLYIGNAAITPDTQPIAFINSPPSYTVSAVVHVFDGQVANIAQLLRVQAGASGNGSADADASDTAYFNLSTSDASASYSTASGTVFPTSGDPFAGAVPEPSTWALFGAGVVAIMAAVRRRRRVEIRSTPAVVLSLLTLGMVPAAQAQAIYVTGQTGADVANFQSQGSYTSDDHTLGNAFGPQPFLYFEGTVRSTGRYDAIPSDPLLGRQTADASIYANAAIGGLRGLVNANTSVGSIINNVTRAQGYLTESWSDVVTFHTSNPLGTDYTFSITLDDSLGATMTLGAGYASNSGASAQASTSFYLGSGDPLLSVSDLVSQYVPSSGPAVPAPSNNPPAQRTVSAVVHVFDGQQLNLTQTLQLQAGVNGGGSAFADAADTAYFNLYTGDALASYSTASGTVFLTSGDPFASPVPEPSAWALFGSGLIVIGFFGRRRPAQSAWRLLLLARSHVLVRLLTMNSCRKHSSVLP